MPDHARITDVTFFDNTNERLPCVLVLDGSSSMAGEPIKELNAGLELFERELKSDPMASQRVQVLVIRLGDNDTAEVISDWTDALSFSAPKVEANGSTPLGLAVQLAMSKLDEQKVKYRANGIQYKRPWLFVMSDGAPTDADWERIADVCKADEAARKFSVFGIGVGSANLGVLGRFSSERKAALLQGTKFREFFLWLSKSVSAGSHAPSGATAQLPPPSDWMSVPTT